MLLPGDGRGISDVIDVRLRVWDVAWWGVLQCAPTVTTEGVLPQIESRCFSGRVEYDLKSVLPTAPLLQVTLEVRQSPNGILSALFHQTRDDAGIEYVYLVPSNEPGGLPPTTYLMPPTGQSISGVTWIQLFVGVGWTTLLQCVPSLSTPMAS